MAHSAPGDCRDTLDDLTTNNLLANSIIHNDTTVEENLSVSHSRCIITIYAGALHVLRTFRSTNAGAAIVFCELVQLQTCFSGNLVIMHETSVYVLEFTALQAPFN